MWKHPDWAALDQSGKPKLTSTMGGSKVVMCLASPFQDAAADRVNDAIERFHLAYVKLDLTTIFNAYGEAPGCWAKGHYHGDWAESLNMIYEGISHVTSRIYEKHPDVLLDLTFELWGQKHVIDAGLLAAGDLDWMSNVKDAQPDAAGTVQARTLLYSAISFDARRQPCSSEICTQRYQTPRKHCHRHRFRASAAGRSAEAESRGSAVVSGTHSIGSSSSDEAPHINESFFPLGSWRQPSAAEWDGFARLSHTGDGVIAVFRNQSNTSTASIQLPLMPAGSFKVHSVVTNKDLGTFRKTIGRMEFQLVLLVPNPSKFLKSVRSTECYVYGCALKDVPGKNGED